MPNPIHDEPDTYRSNLTEPLTLTLHGYDAAICRYAARRLNLTPAAYITRLLTKLSEEEKQCIRRGTGK